MNPSTASAASTVQVRPTGSTPRRALRRDAAHNRELIIAAARDLFAERGLDVGLNEVARRAGVGVGTVYRRFPELDLLVEEVFARQADEFVAIAERAAARDDSWAGLVEFMESINTHVADHRGLRDVMLRARAGLPSVSSTRARMAPAVEGLLARAKADGHVRSDVVRTDLVMIDVMVDAVRRYFADDGPEQWRRALGLALDGLRVHRDRPTPLPVGPLLAGVLDHAMRTAHTRP